MVCQNPPMAFEVDDRQGLLAQRPSHLDVHGVVDLLPIRAVAKDVQASRHALVPPGLDELLEEGASDAAAAQSGGLAPPEQAKQ